MRDRGLQLECYLVETFFVEQALGEDIQIVARKDAFNECPRVPGTLERFRPFDPLSAPCKKRTVLTRRLH